MTTSCTLEVTHVYRPEGANDYYGGRENEGRDVNYYTSTHRDGFTGAFVVAVNSTHARHSQRTHVQALAKMAETLPNQTCRIPW